MNDGLRESEEDAFENIPSEVHCRILWKLDRKTLKVARLVSKKWKFLVSEAVDLKFNCDLTDDTFRIVVKSDEIISCLKIHDFQGTNGNNVSAATGNGFVFGRTEAIHVIGPKINAVELRKIMNYGVSYVTELSLKDCNWPVMKASIDQRKPYMFLKCLRVMNNAPRLHMSTSTNFKSAFPSHADTLFLKMLDTPQAVLQLPFLQDFSLTYERVRKYVDDKISRESYVTRHLAVYKFILRFHQTLKNVCIQRNGENRMFGDETRDFGGPELTQLMMECERELANVQLETLHVDIFFDRYGGCPWVFERTLIQEQRALKELSINMDNSSFRNSAATVIRRLIPGNSHQQQLTSIKINTRNRILEHENEAVDLNILTQSQNLKTLELRFNLGSLTPRFISSNYVQTFSNVEQLPLTITRLHLKDRGLLYALSLVNLISRNGIRWIIDNLKGLESLQLQLLTCEGVDRLQPNSVVNIDPPTLQNLLSLKKLEEMSLHIIRINHESGHNIYERWYVDLLSVTRDEIQVYGAICEEHPRTQFALIERDRRVNISYMEISQSKN